MHMDGSSIIDGGGGLGGGGKTKGDSKIIARNRGGMNTTSCNEGGAKLDIFSIK
jgi:hypothetical protein